MDRDDAIDNLKRALDFYDRVNASSPDDKAAVGQDHWEWLERASREVVAAE